MTKYILIKGTQNDLLTSFLFFFVITVEIDGVECTNIEVLRPSSV
jgi:hypothetical protein